MNSDFKDLWRIFANEKVEYLIVGAYAVIHYTHPRYTKDIDLWVKPSTDNASRVARAFQEFGLPMIEVTQDDFANEGLQFVVGLPPCQIDFPTTLPGSPNFEAAWQNRTTESLEDIPIHYLGKLELVRSKQAAGRPQDLADLDELRRAETAETEI